MRTNGWTWLALALALAGPGVIAMLWKKSAKNRVFLGASALWLAAFIVLLATVLAIALWREEATWAEIGFGAISWLSVPFGIMLTVFFIGVFGPIASWALARAGAGSFELTARFVRRSAYLVSLPNDLDRGGRRRVAISRLRHRTIADFDRERMARWRRFALRVWCRPSPFVGNRRGVDHGRFRGDFHSSLYLAKRHLVPNIGACHY